MEQKMDILDNWFNSRDPTVIRTHETIFIPKYDRRLGKNVVRGWRKSRDSEHWDAMLKDEDLLKEFLEEQLLNFCVPPKRWFAMLDERAKVTNPDAQRLPTRGRPSAVEKDPKVDAIR